MIEQSDMSRRNVQKVLEIQVSIDIIAYRNCIGHASVSPRRNFDGVRGQGSGVRGQGSGLVSRVGLRGRGQSQGSGSVSGVG